MTRLTRVRESGSHVIRIGDGREFGGVTGITGCGCARVLVADMTVGALYRSMSTRQWKPCLAVIKRGAEPLNCGMAQLAILRESRRDVIGGGCGVVIRQMAGHARRRRSGKPALRVTGQATGCGVGSHQRKLRSRVIERCGGPAARPMAHRAIPRERCGLMIGIDGAVIERPVTRGAIRGSPGEAIAGVTIGTRRRQMRSSQREVCEGCMVEPRRKFRVCPLIHRVATLTPGAEADGAVIDRSRRRIIRSMTGNTGRAQPREGPAGRSMMTGFAGGPGVRADQGESIQMLPYRIELNTPALDSVATLAGCTKLTTMNVGMTRRTGCGSLTEYGSHMAACARDLAVLTEQREFRLPVVVELGNSTHGSPGFGDMTVLACDIQVAVRASRSLHLLAVKNQCTGTSEDRRDQQPPKRLQ